MRGDETSFFYAVLVKGEAASMLWLQFLFWKVQII